MATTTYNLDKFKFVDATFDWSYKYVIEFCRQKIDRKIIIPWECMIHANCAREEMFSWLKRANCDQLNIGCESGSQKVLDEMNKATKLETIKRVFDWGKKYSIKRRAFFLTGMPNETPKDIDLTEEFIKEIDPDYVGVSMLCPYPGSDLYDHETMKDTDWTETDEYRNDFWSTEYFTNEQIKENQKRLVSVYKDRMVLRQKDVV
jgi:radical SAM superfamily enzyme YgiQ (UPF0313 family)